MEASWALFVEQYPRVMAAYRKVARMAWFQEEGWVAFVVLPDRDRFNALTIPRMQAMITDWDARYELSETKLSECLNLTVPVTKSNFAQTVADELTQVCRLGPIIDEALAELWP